MGSLNLGPLRISKRQWKSPWSSDPLGQDEYTKLEKRAFDIEDDSEYETDYSSYSSRATSDSHEPMLGGNIPPRRSVSAYDASKHRRKCNKYFTVVIASALLIFIVGLTYLATKSAATNEIHRDPKPFPYESFPFLKRYHGGIRTLISRSENTPEYPGDEEELIEDLLNFTNVEKPNTLQRRKIDKKPAKHDLPKMKIFDPLQSSDGPFKECFLDRDDRIRMPKLHGFEGVVKGFPENVLGSYELLGIDNSLCYDRFGRLGPYGLGYSRMLGGTGACLEGDTEDNDQVWAEEPEVDFRSINWADVQDRCIAKNQHRFAGSKASISSRDVDHDQDLNRGAFKTAPEVINAESDPTSLPGRTMVVIRTWHKYKYDPEDLMYLRALISELSIASGSEYVIHFLIHVQNNDLAIWSDDEAYHKVLNESLPEEFRGMGTLWSDKQMELIYPGMAGKPFRDIHLHGNYRSAFMPVQYLAHKHPEYDYFWHWEMDVRYTGHFYHLFDSVTKWAKQQPRKGLWERNGRFYVPTEHGSWEDFRQMVRVQTEHGTSSKANIWNTQLNNAANDPTKAQKTVEKPVWGPDPPQVGKFNTTNDPQPPTSYSKDKYEWGVGEEADLVTFNPLFDPENTGWNLEFDITGYNTSSGYPPRRAAIVTASRLSRRLLIKMHEETARYKRTMFSEMWPASCALHHGLKAVYVPHPEFIDRRWPTDYLAAVFNGGRNGASGGSRTSAFNDDHQANFLGVTWYYHAGFPGNLWKRWLGYKVDNDGGEKWEMEHEGRMCLPPMLLHPVKQVDMIYEHRDEEHEDKTDMEKHAEETLAVTDERLVPTNGS